MFGIEGDRAAVHVSFAGVADPFGRQRDDVAGGTVPVDFGAPVEWLDHILEAAEAEEPAGGVVPHPAQRVPRHAEAPAAHAAEAAGDARDLHARLPRDGI